MPAEEWVRTFAEAEAANRASLGVKGANLAALSRSGLPVPPGFIVTAPTGNHLTSHGALPPGLDRRMLHAMDGLAALTGRRFGDPQGPLLVSVRASPPASVPGMAATVLNLGLNDGIAEGLAQITGDAGFAWNCFCRFIAAYGEVVLGLDGDGFAEILADEKSRLGLDLQGALPAQAWRGVADRFQAHVAYGTGEPFPHDPREQLRGALAATFASWGGARARAYRALHGVPEEPGAAAVVQVMVFGNRDAGSGAGRASTHDPATGRKVLRGHFLADAQGDDIAGGLREPAVLETGMPRFPAGLPAMADRLKRQFREAQQFEFTVERGRLWLLETGPVSFATAAARLRAAVELAEEGVITHEEAVLRIDPASLDQMLHASVDPDAARDVIVTGLPASPGAATGAVVFSSGAAQEAKAKGIKTILVRMETGAEDIGGMQAAAGVLTARGGTASHAAVVARGMGKPCVSGAGAVKVDARAGTLTAGGRTFQAGDTVTLDGSTGQVLAGAVTLRAQKLSPELSRLMGWADGGRRMGVRANADTPQDARAARAFGAEGIGLCRTEHMFFAPDRIGAMREMILTETPAGRRMALAKILPMQRGDFAELFTVMAGMPVLIRLLDPPLHEFLPRTEEEICAVAAAMSVPAEQMRERVEALQEANPMLGHRGCRLVISYPEIAEMQARAIFEAAAIAAEQTGRAVVPEIMVPLVSMKAEVDHVKARVDAVARAVAAERGSAAPYLIGTMIELPRAALCAQDIAGTAEFFSFGTNDLTQTTFGISRDDAAGFLGTYQRNGVVRRDPFTTLDRQGVGELMRLAVERGRRGRPAIGIGICGEHAGDPASIRFCEEIGLDYVSCSPFRVPVARLAAAQAALRLGKGVGEA